MTKSRKESSSKKPGSTANLLPFDYPAIFRGGRIHPYLSHGKCFEIPRDCEIVEVANTSAELDAGRYFVVREYPAMEEVRELRTKLRMTEEMVRAVYEIPKAKKEKKVPAKKPRRSR